MPISDSSALFGRIVSRYDVSQAVVKQLQTWVPTYVGQLEQQAQLVTNTVPVPPDPIRSYRTGVDFDTWEPSWSPVFIVVAQPIGQAELTGGGGSYIQAFDVQVACNYQYDGKSPMLGEYEEDNALAYVDILGMAACAAILQHGDLGKWPDGSPVSTRTRLAQYPTATLPYRTEESSSRVARSRFALTVVVSDVVTESSGPVTPISNPYASAGNYPTVTTPGVEINVVADDTVVPPGSSSNSARQTPPAVP